MKKTMNNSKYILAAGCSYTDENFSSLPHPRMDVSWPKWPEILSDKLGLPVKNIGKSGIGNDYILSNTIKHLLEDYKNIELVAIGFTEVHRFTMYGIDTMNPLAAVINYRQENGTKKSSYRDIAAMTLYDYYLKEFFIQNDIASLSNSFNKMLSHYFAQVLQIQKLCEVLNVKLIHGHLCGGLSMKRYYVLSQCYNMEWPFKSNQWADVIINTKGFYDIDKSKSVDYPYLEDLKGISFNDAVLTSNLRISKLDGHPNAKGQEVIAEKYYEKYKKTYL